jgi:protease secretion system membrane fusion protein
LEVDADAEKLKALQEELTRTQVRSPVSGQVVGLQFQTVGSVVQPGQKILDVVPLNEGLLLEAKIVPYLIDKVHAGQVADVRFSSFANSPLLAVEGRIESISSDLLTEANMNPDQPGASYYLARIVITPEGLKKLGHHVLQPGMPVQIVIKTGERSLLTYLLHPLIKRLAAALKEE